MTTEGYSAPYSQSCFRNCLHQDSKNFAARILTKLTRNKDNSVLEKIAAKILVFRTNRIEFMLEPMKFDRIHAQLQSFKIDILMSLKAISFSCGIKKMNLLLTVPQRIAFKGVLKSQLLAAKVETILFCDFFTEI